MNNDRQRQEIGKLLSKAVQCSLTIDRAKCLLIKCGLSKRTSELFECLDALRKGFLTVNDLWNFSQDLGLSFTQEQIAFIFGILDVKDTGQLSYKDFLDSIEPQYLLTDELEAALTNCYDNRISFDFNAKHKIDFCLFLKSIYEAHMEFSAVQDKLINSQFSPLDYFRAIDTECKCALDIHDLTGFLGDFIEIGNLLLTQMKMWSKSLLECTAQMGNCLYHNLES